MIKTNDAPSSECKIESSVGNMQDSDLPVLGSTTVDEGRLVSALQFRYIILSLSHILYRFFSRQFCVTKLNSCS